MKNDKKERNSELKIKKITIKTPEALENRLAPGIPTLPTGMPSATCGA